MHFDELDESNGAASGVPHGWPPPGDEPMKMFAPMFNSFDTFIACDGTGLSETSQTLRRSVVSEEGCGTFCSGPTPHAARRRKRGPRFSGVPSYGLVVISFLLFTAVLTAFTTLITSWQEDSIETTATSTARVSLSLIVSNLDTAYNNYFRNAYLTSWTGGTGTPTLCALTAGMVFIATENVLTNATKIAFCPPYGPADVAPAAALLSPAYVASVFADMAAGCPAKLRHVEGLVLFYGVQEDHARVVQVVDKNVFARQVLSSGSPDTFRNAADSVVGLLINVPSSTLMRQGVLYANKEGAANSSEADMRQLSSTLDVCRQRSLLWRVSLFPSRTAGVPSAGVIPPPILDHGGLGRATSALLCAALCEGNCSKAWSNQYSNFVVVRINFENKVSATLIVVAVGTVALAMIVIFTLLAMCLCITLPSQVLNDQIVSILVFPNDAVPSRWMTLKRSIANSTQVMWAREMRSLSDALNVFSQLYLQSTRFVPEHRLNKHKKEILMPASTAQEVEPPEGGNSGVDYDGASTVRPRSKNNAVESASVVVIYISGVEEAYKMDALRASQQHNHLWSMLTSIARSFEGEVNGIQNASTLVFSWNAFCVNPNHARCAARCATKIAEIIADARKSGVSMGIAATTGSLFCGELSDESCAVDVLIGSIVDIAVQLSRLAAQLPEVYVLATESLKTQVSIFFDFMVVDVIGLGGDNTMTVYDMRAKALDTDTRQAMMAVTYSKAFAHFRQHEFVEAIGLLCNISSREQLQVLGGSSRLVTRLSRLCNYFHQHRDEIPLPYARSLPTWRLYEAAMPRALSMVSATRTSPLPDGIGGRFAGNILNVRTVSAFGALPADATDKREEDLRRDLRRELSDRGGGSSDTGEANELSDTRATVNVSPTTNGTTNGHTHDRSSATLLKCMGDGPLSDEGGSDEMLMSAWNQSITKGTMPRDIDIPREVRVADGVVYSRSAKILGQGTFGVVFLGMECHTGKLVAMKVMPLPDAPADRQNIENEVLIMIRVRHQHLIDFLGYTIHRHHMILIMECVIAGSLASVLDSFRVFSLPTAANYTRHVIKGLARLHEEGVMHRDVKPHNVLVTTMGVCKISDFGASARINELAREERRGLIVHGTPVYLAPEAARGCPSYKSDIWSVGIMFLHLVTGRLPYDTEGMDPAVFVWQLGRGYIAPIIPDDLGDEGAGEFVRKCLESAEADRPTAAELLSCSFMQ